MLSLSLKDLVLTPNLAELSSLFISETHTEANVSKTWGLGNLLHDSCCRGNMFCTFYRKLENSCISALAKKIWLIRAYSSPQTLREILVKNKSYSELLLKK